MPTEINTDKNLILKTTTDIKGYTQEKRLELKSAVNPDTYNAETHTIVFAITTPSVDLSNEVVNPLGLLLPEMKNGQPKMPKALYNHNWSIPAPAKIINLSYNEIQSQWEALIDFDQNDPFGVILEYKYANGYMTDVSVGFKVMLNDIIELSDGAIMFNKWLLLEVSFTNIGDNPDAVSLSLNDCNTILKSANADNVKKYFEIYKEKILLKDKIDETVNMISGINSRLEDIEKKFDNKEIKQEQEPEQKKKQLNFTKEQLNVIKDLKANIKKLKYLI